MITRRRLLTAMAGGSTMLLAPAARAQLDPGTDNYIVYSVAQNGATIGYVLVANTEGRGYGANTENWYLTTNVSTSYALVITPEISESWRTAPPDLGTLSFTMADLTSWTSGTQFGTIFADGSGSTYIGCYWNMKERDNVWSGSITWWSATGTGYLFEPDDQRTLSPVTGSGTAYYITTSPL